MTCAEIEGRLVDLAEGGARAVEGASAAPIGLEEHLARCSACRDKVQLWGGLVPALRSVETEPPHALALRRIENGVERQLASPAPPPRPRGGGRPWILLVLVVAGTSGWLALSDRSRASARQPAGAVSTSVAPEPEDDRDRPASSAAVGETVGAGLHEGEPPIPAIPSAFAQRCAEASRLCRTAIRDANDWVRRGKGEQALRTVTDGLRRASDAPAVCIDRVDVCADELRQVRGEALRAGGRLDSAIEAFRVLDRRSTAPALRQRALCSVAQLEQRLGRHAEARASFERALSVAPQGPLREEALIGAMESAAASGDAVRARALARRYLTEHPKGWRVAAAKRWAAGS